MFERRPTPTILGIGAVIALVSAALILTGQVDWAAVVGGFIPLRVGIDPEALASAPAMVPLWLTPLTATLIHGGWMHLAFNLLMLMIVGAPTQRAVGGRGIAILWLVGAYAAVVAQWTIDPASPMPMVGASGALSAIVGAYSLLYGRMTAKPIGPIPAHIVHAMWLAAAWTAINMIVAWVSTQGGMPVAGAAHVGGFIAGMIVLKPLLRWQWGPQGHA